ncbi:MAG: asparagine synthase (glutamine-hydrolyzing) [Alphaproteobacteria bacterium]
MCGIAGFLDPTRRAAAEALEKTAGRMAATLVHRGPDDDGVWADAEAGLGLGHRRLSILDLSAEGRQPMTSADGRHVLVFNGEIYNHHDIRAALDGESDAPRWRGTSDTEVMVEAINRWGLDRALEAFNGMFAFAVWDRRESTLMLARDRLGEKPLYYGWSRGVFLFASELKALAQHPAWRGEIDRGALALYLRHSFVPAPHSIFKGIAKLLPGHALTLAADGGEDAQRIAPYWSARLRAEQSAADPFCGSDADAIDALDGLITSAVALRMEADVPVGAFLSGGIDSSAVVAAMQRVAKRPVATFTIGFFDAAFNEAEHACAVASHLGTEHTEIYVGERDALDIVPKLATVYDEPFADVSQIPTMMLARLTRRHVTVGLSGDGGDELFGGYGRYQDAARRWHRARMLPSPLRAGLRCAAHHLPADALNSGFGWLGTVLSKRRRPSRPGDRLQARLMSYGAADAIDCYRPWTMHWRGARTPVIGAGNLATAFDDDLRRAPFADAVNSNMFMDAESYLPDDLLVKIDRATMAHGLEARAPLLDHRIAEFSWRLPAAMKIRNGEGKWPLRQVLYRSVPRNLVDRPKMGFDVPVGPWLNGALGDWAEDLLDEGRLKREGFFDPAPIRQRWQEHRAGVRNWRTELWDVLVFQSWYEQWRGTLTV